MAVQITNNSEESPRTTTKAEELGKRKVQYFKARGAMTVKTSRQIDYGTGNNWN